MYAGKRNYINDKVKLLKSTDSGATWHVVSELPTIYFLDMAISASDPEVIYVSTSHLLRSVDHGYSWDEIGADIDLQTEFCLTSSRHSNWVWADLSFLSLSIDFGKTWRRKWAPSPYQGYTVTMDSNPIMGPDWAPYLFFASSVDGVWIHAEDLKPQIMLAGTHQKVKDNESSLVFNAWITDVSGPENIAEVEILYQGQETGLKLYDNGDHGDLTPNDGLFTLEIPIQVNSPIINVPYSIKATDINGMSAQNWPALRSTACRGAD